MPDPADQMSSQPASFSVGRNGAWSETTMSSVPSASPAHRPAWFATGRKGGLTLTYGPWTWMSSSEPSR
jgi:hypothetical protein